MRRRSTGWLLVAGLLLALATWLLGVGEEEAPRLQRAEQVEFPTYMRMREMTRAHERRRPELEVETDTDNDEEEYQEPVVTDPVLRALPSAAGGSAVVIEANALRHSALGQMFIDCLPRGEHDDLHRVQKELGFDPLEDLDRVAFSDDVMLFSGHLAEANWPQIFAGWQSESYGDRARVYWRQGNEGDLGGVTAVWGDELLLSGPDRKTVQEALDRVEGRRPPSSPLREDQTYGEVYGVLGADQVAEFFPAGQSPIADRLREVVGQVELHVDAMDDVALAARFVGPQGDDMDDLGRSIGAALAIARMTAIAQGEEELALLLEYARIEPSEGAFSLELALPQELLAEHLSKACAARRAMHDVQMEPGDPGESSEQPSPSAAGPEASGTGGLDPGGGLDTAGDTRD